jgi:hypothetical protein
MNDKNQETRGPLIFTVPACGLIVAVRRVGASPRKNRNDSEFRAKIDAQTDAILDFVMGFKKAYEEIQKQGEPAPTPAPQQSAANSGPWTAERVAKSGIFKNPSPVQSDPKAQRQKRAAKAEAIRAQQEQARQERKAQAAREHEEALAR